MMITDHSSGTISAGSLASSHFRPDPTRSHLRTSFCLGLVHCVINHIHFYAVVFLLNICGSKVLPGGRCGPESGSRLFCAFCYCWYLPLIQALPVLMHCVPANQHYRDAKSRHLRTTGMRNPGTSCRTTGRNPAFQPGIPGCVCMGLGGLVGWLASMGRHRRAAHRRAGICKPARRCRLGDATSRHRQDGRCRLGSSMPNSHRQAAAGGLARACAEPKFFFEMVSSGTAGHRRLAVGALLGSEAAAAGLWARGERTSASASG